MNLEFFEVRAEVDTGDPGETARQVFHLVRLQGAKLGDNAVLDLAFFTIRFGESIISVRLAVRLPNRLRLEIHGACILSYATHLSRDAVTVSSAGHYPVIVGHTHHMRRNTNLASLDPYLPNVYPTHFRPWSPAPDAETPIFQGFAGRDSPKAMAKLSNL